MNHQRIKLNETAYFDTYLLHASNEYNVGKKRPLVIVCPGGGYAFTSDREAEPIALKFNSIGMHCVVLWYTVMDQVKNVPQNAWMECAMVVKQVREHAEEWLVEHDQIIVCGFSAGGHLALQTALRWQEKELAEKLHTTSDQLKINLAIAAYPSVQVDHAFEEEDFGFAASLIAQPNTANERYFGVQNPDEQDVNAYNLCQFVSEFAPPMFVWHTFEDVLVDVQNSLQLAQSLRQQNVPFELHIFEKGEHGLALCDRTTARKASHHNSHVKHWFTLCEEWLSPYIDKED